MKNHKNIVATIIVFFCAAAMLQAQNPLDKFVGTWQWIGGQAKVVGRTTTYSDEMNLIIKKVCVTDASKGVYNNCDILFIWHEYKRDGVVIESTLSYITTNPTFDTKRLGLGGLITDENDAIIENYLRITIRDVQKDKLGDVDFTYIPPPAPPAPEPGKITRPVRGGPTAKWHLTDMQGLTFKTRQPGFSYPIDAVFTKMD